MGPLRIAVLIALLFGMLCTGAPVAMAFEFRGLHFRPPNAVDDPRTSEQHSDGELGIAQTRPEGTLGTLPPRAGFGPRSRLGVMDDPCKRIGCWDVRGPETAIRGTGR